VYIAGGEQDEHGGCFFRSGQDQAGRPVPHTAVWFVAHTAFTHDVGFGKKLAPARLEGTEDELLARLEQWPSACLGKARSRHESQSWQTKR
jgi:hypothetical protein